MTDLGQLHSRSPKYALVPAKLIHDTTITPGAVRLYAHMHWRYGKTHKNFEGQERMAGYLGVSEKTIANWTRELESRGWVVVVERESDKTGRPLTNFYHVFEETRDSRKFRKTYKPADNERIREAPTLAERKTRKGTGGKPSHKNSSSDVKKQEVGGTQVPMDGGTQVPPIHDQDSSITSTFVVSDESTEYRDLRGAVNKHMYHESGRNDITASIASWLKGGKRQVTVSRGKQSFTVDVAECAPPATVKEARDFCTYWTVTKKLTGPEDADKFVRAFLEWRAARRPQVIASAAPIDYSAHDAALDAAAFEVG